MRVAEAHSALTAAWNDWQGILANPNYIREHDSITWPRFRPFTIDDPVFSEDVADLSDERQYSFQVSSDGALIQIRYIYRYDDVLSAASLTYLSPGSFDDVPVGWLRIDYDPAAARSILHAGCHMHLSFFPEARLQVSGVPNPKQFVEFVLATFYPNQYLAHRLDAQMRFRDEAHVASVNSPCPSYQQDHGYRLLTHVHVPPQASSPVSPVRLVRRLRNR